MNWRFEMQAIGFVEDFKYSHLVDRRLHRRLLEIVSVLSPDPGRSFPKAMSPGDLLGYYRFVGNGRVSFEDVLSGHIQETVRRTIGESDSFILHDTTDCECSSVKFRAHISLSVCPNRKPLGVLNTILLRRGSQEKKSPGEANEHVRWQEGIEKSHELVPNSVHVYDREADDYKLFAWQIENKIRFVARSRHDRLVAGGERLSMKIESMNTIAERMVPLSGRGRGNKSKEDLKSHPIRAERLALLAISAEQIEFLETGSKQKSIAMNVVHAKEKNPPEGETAIEWRLLTNEPINTVEEILRIIDIYRVRWVIEEFFKALKTGCQFEKRQHESFEAMSIALAVLMPMALQALALRSLSRDENDYLATEVLTTTQLKILSLLPRTKKLPNRTVKQALLAVAALGGHLKNNGNPGWLTIGRGLETLLQYEIGWTLASEQSTM